MCAAFPPWCFVLSSACPFSISACKFIFLCFIVFELSQKQDFSILLKKVLQLPFLSKKSVVEINDKGMIDGKTLAHECLATWIHGASDLSLIRPQMFKSFYSRKIGSLMKKENFKDFHGKTYNNLIYYQQDYQR